MKHFIHLSRASGKAFLVSHSARHGLSCARRHLSPVGIGNTLGHWSTLSLPWHHRHWPWNILRPKVREHRSILTENLEAYHPVENRIALCISYCPSIKQLLIWGRPNHQKTSNCEDFLYDTLLGWLFVRVTTFCSQGKKLVRKQNCKALMARYSPCSGGDCSGWQNTIYPQKLALAGQICQRKRMVLCLVKVFRLS